MTFPTQAAGGVTDSLHQTIQASLSQVTALQDPSHTISVGREVATRRLQKRPAEIRRLGYTEGRELGRGGLGLVIEATQQAFDRPVAIKRLLTSGDRVTAMQFYAEAMIAAQLEHPNIVPIHDLLSDSSGTLALVMKRVEGTSWKAVLATGSRPLEDHLEILLKVCEAVEFAHSRGIIHRDLKPENVMLGTFGEVSVMDWGCALAFGEREQHPVVPRAEEAESIAGTPAYMAPEMVVLTPNRLGPASDVYLLGAILYEVLTGSRVHLGSTVMEVLSRAAVGEVESPQRRAPERHIPDELAAITLAALHPDPSSRTPSAAALGTALRAYRQHAQAVLLASHARSHLHALKGGDLARADQTLQRAVSAAENAVDLWPDWPAGRMLHAQATLAWARHCLATGGFLQAQALSLQAVGAARACNDEPAVSQAVTIGKKARAGAAQAKKRSRNLALARAGALIAAALVAVVSTTGFIWIRAEHRTTERALAESERARANLQQEQDARHQDQRRFAPGLLAQARGALTRSDRDEAAGDLAAAISFDPTLIDAVYLNAMVLASLGRYQDALQGLGDWKHLGGDAAEVEDLVHLCTDAASMDPSVLGNRLADFFQRVRLPTLVSAKLATPASRLAIYRQRMDQAWPGVGQYLEMKDDSTVLFGYPHGLGGRKDLVDLAPLTGIPFCDLNLTDTGVLDLGPLQGMPLQCINLSGTAVKDLSPLEHCPLTSIWASDCYHIDVNSLAHLHLHWVLMAHSPVASLEVFRGMPLEEVTLDGTFQDISPIVQDHLHAASLYGRVQDFSPLRACQLDTLGAGGDFTDISMLAGPRLKRVEISSSQPVRLGALGRLESLTLTNSIISDPEDLPRISPRILKLQAYSKMPDLRRLDGTRLEELSLEHMDNFQGKLLPQNMVLRQVEVSWSGAMDLGFLAQQPLHVLSLFGVDPSTWRSLAALRQMPLDSISNRGVDFTPAKFWAAYDPAVEMDPHAALSTAVAVGAVPLPALTEPAVGRQPGLSCEVVPGISSSVDDMAKVKATRTTIQNTIDLSALGTAENTGLRFQGFLRVPKNDVYSFALGSDDGSRLIIDGRVVVDNDGLHADITRTGAINLAAGAHRVSLWYFQASGGSALHLEMSTAGMPPAEIPAASWTH